MNSSNGPQSSDPFCTTRWSVVVAAANSRTSVRVQALSNLCQRYWYPVYAYIRRRTPDSHVAEDRTQAFFAYLLEKDTFAVADQSRGRFRAFLITSLKHFLSNERARENTQKRGGGTKTLSLDFDEAAQRYTLEPHHNETPDHFFERQWTLTLLQNVLDRLETIYIRNNQLEIFNHLKQFLTGQELSHKLVAEALGINESASRQALRRLRKKYRELLHDEIVETVSSPDEAEAELNSLFQSLEY